MRPHASLLQDPLCPLSATTIDAIREARVIIPKGSGTPSPCARNSIATLRAAWQAKSRPLSGEVLAAYRSWLYIKIAAYKLSTSTKIGYVLVHPCIIHNCLACHGRRARVDSRKYWVLLRITWTSRSSLISLGQVSWPIFQLERLGCHENFLAVHARGPPTIGVLPIYIYIYIWHFSLFFSEFSRLNALGRRRLLGN